MQEWRLVGMATTSCDQSGFELRGSMQGLSDLVKSPMTRNLPQTIRFPSPPADQDLSDLPNRPRITARMDAAMVSHLARNRERKRARGKKSTLRPGRR